MKKSIAQLAVKAAILVSMPRSQAAKDLATQTSLLLKFGSKKGLGSAVLVGPSTVVTAGHNLRGADLTTGFVHRAATREKSGIKSAELILPDDLAILTLKVPFMEPFAKIDYSSEPAPYAFVVMPHLDITPEASIPSWAVRAMPKLKLDTEKSEYLILPTIKKGILIKAESDRYTDADKAGGEGSAKIYTCLIPSRPGDSGSGVFFCTGGLMSIHTLGAGALHTGGPSLPKFRAIMKDYNIPAC